MSPDSQSQHEHHQFAIELGDQGQRIDRFLIGVLPHLSRVKVGRLIHKQLVTVNQQATKPAYRVRVGDHVSVSVPPPEPMGSKPENIPLDILFEDDDVIAVNKPAGMVVHPAKGNWSGTLTAALSFHFSTLSSVGGEHRPGIVHRLDRDTTGVILIAKTDMAHVALTEQFEKRTVEKTYRAIVSPAPDRDRDWIRQPIGVHPYQREKMAIREDHKSSRPAETFFEVQRRFKGFADILAFPKTGRTHQIRLHLAHIGAPILCDRLYSGRAKLNTATLTREPEGDDLLCRQALHAQSIKFKLLSGKQLEVSAPLPEDMAATLAFLEKNRPLPSGS